MKAELWREVWHVMLIGLLELMMRPGLQRGMHSVTVLSMPMACLRQRQMPTTVSCGLAAGCPWHQMLHLCLDGQALATVQSDSL